MAALAFLTTAIYWPGVAGAATTPRWALLSYAAPWLLREQHLTPAHVCGLAFLTWAIASLAWDPARLDGIQGIATLLIGAACFCLGNQQGSLRGVIIGAGLGLIPSSIVAIIQAAGYHPVETITPIAGLFINGNYMGEAAALVLIGAVCERIWWLIPGLLPALVLAEARGALVACTVALVIRWRSPTAAAILFLGVAGAFFLKDSNSLSERLLIWQSAWNGLTLFGRGIGSFWSVYPAFDLRPSPAAMPEFAHNEALNVLFELGVPGVLLACAFCATLAGPLDTPRLILIALLVESCFAFPTHMPVTAFLGMVAAGHAVRTRYVLGELPYRFRVFGATWLTYSWLRRFNALAAVGRANHAVRPQIS